MKGREEERKNNTNVTNNRDEFLVDCTIENQDSKRYTPTPFKDKGIEKNSLMIINALYKKGLINVETLSSIEKKYGRLGE